ncbi:DUF1758 domain-containing protein [Trichonephila clavipes]|nr:DUF1758 domain-containing protein [Trichonephila clavipes]
MYGTASAPFLAIRTLAIRTQLAMDEASRFPLAFKVALQDVYMDDVVSGAQNLDTARQLQSLEKLKKDRYILTDFYVKLMLLGYADASESAYRAVVYMHSVKEDGTTTIKLIGSKSRVAPIKVISIPRIELSACLLLTQLVEKVLLFLQVHLAKVILHTDSIIALPGSSLQLLIN